MSIWRNARPQNEDLDEDSDEEVLDNQWIRAEPRREVWIPNRWQGAAPDRRNGQNFVLQPQDFRNDLIALNLPRFQPDENAEVNYVRFTLHNAFAPNVENNEFEFGIRRFHLQRQLGGRDSYVEITIFNPIELFCTTNNPQNLYFAPTYNGDDLDHEINQLLFRFVPINRQILNTLPMYFLITPHPDDRRPIHTAQAGVFSFDPFANITLRFINENIQRANRRIIIPALRLIFEETMFRPIE